MHFSLTQMPRIEEKVRILYVAANVLPEVFGEWDVVAGDRGRCGWRRWVGIWAAGRVNEFPAGDAGVCEDFGELQQVGGAGEPHDGLARIDGAQPCRF
jgi:hypothetical protein